MAERRKKARQQSSKPARRKGQEVKGGKFRNIFYVVTSRTAMIIMAALLVLSYLFSYLNPEHYWLLTIFGLAFIPLALINVVLLCWALSRKSKSLFIPLLALLPALFYVGRYVQFSGEPDCGPATEEEDRIKLVSWNVGRFSSDEDRKGQEICAQEVYAWLQEQDPDLICLQEVWLENVDRVRAYFKSRMPGYHFKYYLAQGRHGAFGNVTLSRFPIVGGGKIKFEKSANMAIYTDIRTEKGIFRIYNCHFESYNISLPHLIKSLANDHEKALKETGDKLEASISRRPAQVNRVMDSIFSSELPSIVCGDFNDSPMSYTYNRLMKGRQDAFVEAGTGFGATYRFLWPALRIDYALFPEHYTVCGHDIPKIGYSDHYPVTTYFLI